jgi:hypothetical protein
MNRTTQNDGKSHRDKTTTPDPTISAEMTSDQDQPPPDHQELDKTASAALIRFFKTLDQWDREAKK